MKLKEIEGPIVMYVDYEGKSRMQLFEGKVFYGTSAWSAKMLNDKEVVLIENDKPKYIIPNVPKPENLKIYTGRFYNGEKIPEGN